MHRRWARRRRPRCKDDRILHHGQHVAVVVARDARAGGRGARAWSRSTTTRPPGAADRRPPRRRCCSTAGAWTSSAATSPPRWPRPTWSTTRPSPPRRTPTTRWACSRPWPRWDGDPLTVHDATPVADDGAHDAGDGVRSTRERRPGARPLRGRRVRRRAPRLAARDPDRARGPGRRAPGQAGADPAADVHLRRPPARDRAARPARRHPRRRAGRDRPRGHLDVGAMEDDRLEPVTPVTGDAYACPNVADTRPAGPAEHSKPRLRCAAPARRRATSRWSPRSTSCPTHWASTRSSCGCATTPRSTRSRAAVVEQGAAGVLPGRRRTVRLGAAATPRSARCATATGWSGTAWPASRSRLVPGTLPGHGVDRAATVPRTCAAPPPTSVPAPTRSRRRSRPNCSGLDIDQVRVEIGDSDLPPAPHSGGSGLATSLSGAIHDAVGKLVRAFLDLVGDDESSPLRGRSPDDVTATDGGIHVVDAPSTVRRTPTCSPGTD